MSRRWPLERVLFALAGSITLVSILLAAIVTPWFLLLTTFVGVSQWLYVVVGRLPGFACARALLRDRSAVPLVSAVATARLAAAPVREHPEAVGPVGRLGRWTVDHGRAVAIAWIVIAIGFGFFAPRVESALSGAGWQANGSQSVQARTLIQKNFAGLSSSALMVVVHSPTQTVGDAGFRSTVAAVERTLRSERTRRLRVSTAGGLDDLG